MQTKFCGSFPHDTKGWARQAECMPDRTGFSQDEWILSAAEHDA
jgi:hypothetical protein